MTKERDVYSAELRQDQWDLIVMALEHVRKLIDGTQTSHAIDHLGRQFLRRCVLETSTDILSQVPRHED